MSETGGEFGGKIERRALPELKLFTAKLWTNPAPNVLLLRRH